MKNTPIFYGVGTFLFLMLMSLTATTGERDGLTLFSYLCMTAALITIRKRGGLNHEKFAWVFVFIPLLNFIPEIPIFLTSVYFACLIIRYAFKAVNRLLSRF
jgi:hypothetical protein